MNINNDLIKNFSKEEVFYLQGQFEIQLMGNF